MATKRKTLLASKKDDINYNMNYGSPFLSFFVHDTLSVMESRDPLFGVSVLVSKVSGLVSVSKDFGLGLELFVSRLCIAYFLWSFGRRSSLKKWFLKLIVQNLAVQRGQWLSFLCCYVVCKMEKTICPLSRLKFILNSIKNVHVPKKPQRVFPARRGWEYFAKDYLRTVFLKSLVMKPIGLFKRGGRVPKSFFFKKPNKTMSFCRSAFQSTLLKHAGEVIFYSA